MHNYISSIDYINNLTFDYVETYSFQRGANFGLRDQEGKSAYLIAFQKGFLDILQVMTERLEREEKDESKKCSTSRLFRA
ncbi:MAG: hypothetical protein ABL927_13880, partial [Bdellovibrionales bacterium]